MSVLLHPRTAAVLAAIDGRRSGSWLFYGPTGVGKATAAADLARQLACPEHHVTMTDACVHCRQFVTGAYPDFHLIRPLDKPSITIEQIRRLATALATRAYHSITRLALIDDAHLLTVDAQNALLKLIEEPPAHTVIILATDRPDALLGTIRSRTAAVYFPTPLASDIAELLITRHPSLDTTTANELVTAAAHAPGTALQLAADPERLTTERQLADTARATLTAARFERLRLAAHLADTKANLQHFGALLQADLTTKLRAGRTSATTLAPAFAALEQFRRHLAANVAPRVALECLVLGL